MILTADADPEVEAEARRAGASGFVAKGTRLDDIVIVLHEVDREVGLTNGRTANR